MRYGISFRAGFAAFALMALVAGTNPALARGRVTASIPEGFAIQAPTAGWERISEPMPGVEAAFMRKGKAGSRANITVIQDRTAQAYASLDEYVQAAVKILREQGIQEIFEVREASSPDAGSFRVVHSRKADAEMVQGIYFRKGRGFYVVTAVAPRAEFAALAGEFERVLRSARFSKSPKLP